jgi:arylsulfatase A-like enzyme
MAKVLKPNILFLGIDSLRRDHLSCYGYPRLTSPHLDRLAANGTLFEDSFSPHIPTPPGYAGMLCGRDVFGTDRVSLREPGPIMDTVATLPEMLREQGYRSVGIGLDTWLVKGFDEYQSFGGSWGPWEERPLRKAEELNKVTLPILDRLAKGKEPWMLFLRHMDPHAPYLPPAPFDTMFYQGDPCAAGNRSMEPVFGFKPFAEFLRSWMPPGITDKEYVIAQYDGEVAYMDACIQQLFERLRALGQWENTLIVVTADHGETLYDHNVFFDHHSLYEPTLVVPMIYHWPGHVPAGKRVRGMVQLMDIVPSIFELMGWQAMTKKQRFDGKSVWPLARGEAPENYAEMLLTECTWMRKHGLRTHEWKFIEALEPDFHGLPKQELYNLIADPAESRNLVDAEPAVLNLLRERMVAHIARRTAATGRPDPIERFQLGTGLSIGSVASAKKLQEKK